jgi:hypothetical protein
VKFSVEGIEWYMRSDWPLIFRHKAHSSVDINMETQSMCLVDTVIFVYFIVTII